MKPMQLIKVFSMRLGQSINLIGVFRKRMRYRRRLGLKLRILLQRTISQVSKEPS